MVGSDKIDKAIRGAWIAALIVAARTLVMSMVWMLADVPTPFAELFNAWTLIDAGASCAFAYGIYRRSRACAVGMLVLFVGGQVMSRLETGVTNGVIPKVIIAVLLARGVSATFQARRREPVVA
jgi:hypothetical protein